MRCAKVQRGNGVEGISACAVQSPFPTSWHVLVSLMLNLSFRAFPSPTLSGCTVLESLLLSCMMLDLHHEMSRRLQPVNNRFCCLARSMLDASRMMLVVFGA
jgi:hypothetical protein